MAEHETTRKLTAILSADVFGYSRLMGQDEEATVRTLTAYRREDCGPGYRVFVRIGKGQFIDRERRPHHREAADRGKRQKRRAIVVDAVAGAQHCRFTERSPGHSEARLEVVGIREDEGPRRAADG